MSQNRFKTWPNQQGGFVSAGSHSFLKGQHIGSAEGWNVYTLEMSIYESLSDKWTRAMQILCPTSSVRIPHTYLVCCESVLICAPFTLPGLQKNSSKKQASQTAWGMMTSQTWLCRNFLVHPSMEVRRGEKWTNAFPSSFLRERRKQGRTAQNCTEASWIYSNFDQKKVLTSRSQDRERMADLLYPSS